MTEITNGRLTTRVLAMPADTNPSGDIFGGWLLSQISIPFLLGSFLAVVPALLAILLLAIRTAKEDRFLRQNLDGYSDYAQAVRFRLLPGLW